MVRSQPAVRERRQPVVAAWLAGWLCIAIPALGQVDVKVHPAADFGGGVFWLDLQPESPGVELNSFTFDNNCQLQDQP